MHSKSLGHSNRMFHGTWGYVHSLNQTLLNLVSPGDLTLESYKIAMSKISELCVVPKMFLPQPKDTLHWKLVLKSQIAQTLLESIAQTSDSQISIATTPPPIDQISTKEPDITMLKLMKASDNSAQGVGKVFEAIVNQSNITMTDFANCLQIIDADLGLCTNISSLHAQRVPSRHVEEGLQNTLTILGASHTLWNVSHAIYSKHYGESSDSRDSGAWRFL